MKNKIAEKIPNKKLEDKVEKNPPKGKVKRERQRKRGKKSRKEGRRGRKERDERYDGQCKRNR